MATFKFEALDTTGTEVKDQIQALSEEEAQQKIRQMGYFVTKITEVGDKKKKGKKGVARRRSRKRARPLPWAASRPSSSARSPGNSRRCRTPACPCCVQPEDSPSTR